MTVLAQDYELVPLDKLSLHPDNPRRGDTDAIHASLRENGFYGAIVAQRSTGRILAGNHRWLAAHDAGVSEVPVVWVDVDDDRARRIMLADNRTNDLAAYNEADLVALLDELAVTPDALAGTAFDFDALDGLRVNLGDEETLPPQPSGAAYAETEDEERERDATRGLSPSQREAGLREIILVYAVDEHAEATELIRTLRGEHTASTAVLAALRFAASDRDGYALCLEPQTS